MGAAHETEEVQVAGEGVVGRPIEGLQMSPGAGQFYQEYDPYQRVGTDRTLVKPTRRRASRCRLPRQCCPSSPIPLPRRGLPQ